MNDPDKPMAALFAEAEAALAELTDALDALADHLQEQELALAEMENRIGALEAELMRPGVVPPAWRTLATHDAPRPQ